MCVLKQENTVIVGIDHSNIGVCVRRVTTYDLHPSPYLSRSKCTPRVISPVKMTHGGGKSAHLWRVSQLQFKVRRISNHRASSQHPVTWDLSNLEYVVCQAQILCLSDITSPDLKILRGLRKRHHLQPYIKIQVTEFQSPCPIVRCLIWADGRPINLTSCKGYRPFTSSDQLQWNRRVRQSAFIHLCECDWFIKKHWQRGRTQSCAIRLLKSLGIDALSTLHFSCVD